MKKSFFILVACFLLTFPVSAHDDAQGTLMTADEAAACAAAEQYLKSWSYNCYMYAENDLTAGTILDPSLSANDISAVAVQLIARDSSVNMSADAIEQEVNTAADRLKCNMQFMIDKATFFAEKGRLSDSGALKNFSLAYYVQAVNIADSVATVEINEGIGWQYPELDVPSSSYEEHTVQLAKINGEWFVIDVETAYDWFHQRYKNAGYDIDALIAQERADFQAQREYGKEYREQAENAAGFNEDALVEIQENVSTVRSYSQESAQRYALTYTAPTGASNVQSYYNSSVFNNYSGENAGDCMNFASQVIYAGFHGSNNAAQVDAGNVPQDKIGTSNANSKWYAKPTSTYWAWTSCDGFQKYITYSGSDSSTRLYASMQTIESGADFAAVGQSNLLGSILHVEENSTTANPYGHAVVITKVEGTSRDQIYFSAHSRNKQNIKLSKSYSGKLIFIRPMYFYDVVSCTGTSHTFATGHSKCSNCNYVRTYIAPNLVEPVKVNSSVTLSARVSHTVSSLSISVTDPNGTVTNGTTVSNAGFISMNYTPTVADHPNDLYTVVVTAISVDGVIKTHTWTFRAIA